MKRKKVPPKTQVELLKRSRRRCCLCFGLSRDEEEKVGQVVHLDHDPANCDLDNLAWMCLEHHDAYDSKTSQSKAYREDEAKAYREELHEHFQEWQQGARREEMLNLLGSSITTELILDTALRIAKGMYLWPEELLRDVLSAAELEYMDNMEWGPRAAMLDYLQSWGLLTYSLEEVDRGGIENVRIEVKHRAICRELVELLDKRSGSQG